MSYAPLTSQERVALFDVSADLGVRSLWTWSLIEFESRWNPLAKNPTSSARGLIQFMDSTARSMGYLGSMDLVIKHPTRESQLRGPVLTYLREFMPYNDEQDLYMAVFYPRARGWSPDARFPLAVRKANPGINTVGDYVYHVKERAGRYPYSEEEVDGED